MADIREDTIIIDITSCQCFALVGSLFLLYEMIKLLLVTTEMLLANIKKDTVILLLCFDACICQCFAPTRSLFLLYEIIKCF